MMQRWGRRRGETKSEADFTAFNRPTQSCCKDLSVFIQRQQMFV